MRPRLSRVVTTTRDGVTFRSDRGWEVSKVYDLSSGLQVGTIERIGRHGNRPLAKSGYMFYEAETRKHAIELIADWTIKRHALESTRDEVIHE